MLIIKYTHDISMQVDCSCKKIMKKYGKSFDVDIELDNSINIQVWYVTGLLNNFIIN